MLTAASFLPFDLVNTTGLVGWFYLCLYSVKRTYTSPLIAEPYRSAAGVAALFIGPLLLAALFIVDTVQKLDEGSLSGRQVFFYVLDSLVQKERPVAEVLSEDSSVPFKVTTFSGQALSDLKEPAGTSVDGYSADNWKPRSFIDLTREGVLVQQDDQEEVGDEAPPRTPLSKKTTCDSAVPSATTATPQDSKIQELLRKAIGHHVEHLLIDSVGGGQVMVQAERDGCWGSFLELERAEGVKLIRDLHLLAEIAFGVSTVSHTGSFFVEVGPKKYCLRVVSVPSLDGYKLSVRVIEPWAGAGLNTFGLSDAQIELVNKNVLSASGLILISGPRDHSRDDFFYSLLSLPGLKDKARFLLQTYADKILSGTTQIEVDWSQGMSFPQSIRDAMLASARVIAIDQMRNAETAQAAVEASQNGALVLAGMYAESSEEALLRLTQWGLPLGHFLADVRLLIALRQVRLLCPKCKRKERLSDFQRSYLEGRKVKRSYVYHAVGCQACDGTGYHGRTALVEILQVDCELVRRYTSEELKPEAMVRQGRDRLFHFLRKAGMRKALAGETSLEEIKRVSSELE
jgi:type II secretory ATPase GspE/PulE/Tfp pilus assembly ATPase PilB-like protein